MLCLVGKKTLGCLLLLVLVGGCNRSRPSGNGEAPDFTLKDLNGKSVTLQSFRGHPVLMDFWATWCGPCRMSIPLVQQFYARHKAEGLIVLGMNIDDEPADVYAFVKYFNMTYPILFAGQTPVGGAYGVEGIPSFYFLDQQGRVVQHYEGFSPEIVEAWETEFQHLTHVAH